MHPTAGLKSMLCHLNITRLTLGKGDRTVLISQYAHAINLPDWITQEGRIIQLGSLASDLVTLKSVWDPAATDHGASALLHLSKASNETHGTNDTSQAEDSAATQSSNNGHKLASAPQATAESAQRLIARMKQLKLNDWQGSSRMRQAGETLHPHSTLQTGNTLKVQLQNGGLMHTIGSLLCRESKAVQDNFKFNHPAVALVFQNTHFPALEAFEQKLRLDAEAIQAEKSAAIGVKADECGSQVPGAFPSA